MVEQLLKSPFGLFEPAFRLFYEHAGALYFEGERLPADSYEGAQQGDPLGPFIFALAFHATLQQVAAEYPDCVFVWPSSTSPCLARRRARTPRCSGYRASPRRSAT
jgi:hypothetical protein